MPQSFGWQSIGNSGRCSGSWGQRDDCTSHRTPAVLGGGEEATRGGFLRLLSQVARLDMWTWPGGQSHVCIGCKTEQESFLTPHFPEGEN